MNVSKIREQFYIHRTGKVNDPNEREPMESNHYGLHNYKTKGNTIITLQFWRSLSKAHKRVLVIYYNQIPAGRCKAGWSELSATFFKVYSATFARCQTAVTARLRLSGQNDSRHGTNVCFMSLYE